MIRKQGKFRGKTVSVGAKWRQVADCSRGVSGDRKRTIADTCTIRTQTRYNDISTSYTESKRQPAIYSWTTTKVNLSLQMHRKTAPKTFKYLSHLRSDILKWWCVDQQAYMPSPERLSVTLTFERMITQNYEVLLWPHLVSLWLCLLKLKISSTATKL